MTVGGKVVPTGSTTPQVINVNLQSGRSVTPAQAPARARTTTSSSATTVKFPPISAPTAAERARGARAVARIDQHLHGISTWMPYWNTDSTLNRLTSNAKTISEVHPFWWQIDGASQVTNQAGSAGNSYAAALAARGMQVVPTVTETAGQDHMADILSNRAEQNRLISALIWIANQPHSEGIDLDFESIDQGDGDLQAAKAVTQRFPQMFGRLCGLLHAEGKVCEVTVMPRVSDDAVKADGLSYAVYDYAALAAHADRVQVLAYDYHYKGGPAGPVAPISWDRNVIAFATSQMPASKLVLGVPAYGYDWVSGGGEAKSITAADAEALAHQKGMSIEWDGTNQESTFTYNSASGSHRVWFEDTQGTYNRAELAAGSGLSGTAVWTAGDAQPALWPLLNQVH